MYSRRICAVLFVLAVTSFNARLLLAKTVTLGAADNQTTVALNLGDTLVVTFPSAELPDYRWQAHLTASSPLTSLNEQYTPSPAPDHGMGIQTFRFNAARVGQALLMLGFDKQNKTTPASRSSIQTTSTFVIHVNVLSAEPSTTSKAASGYIGTDMLIAVYKGTMPCADCSGLDIELCLYAKGKFDTTDAFFVRTQTYLATRNGDTTYTDRGEWLVLKGDAVNPEATVYQLIRNNTDGNTSEQSEYLLSHGDLLTQLDGQMRPIDLPANSKINLDLHRVH